MRGSGIYNSDAEYGELCFSKRSKSAGFIKFEESCQQLNKSFFLRRTVQHGIS